ncbi:KilA-N domain-containing protein [Pseudomonas kilonensis]|uniref:KilA-N domain-containing protein n=1 Tax=Pseudomonas kilonensis TaxID=132476 RepID=UPI0004659528|nr:KilA-N domain-containing protein [Pseudomonas kilonensis]
MTTEPTKALPLILRDAEGKSFTFIPDTKGMFNLTDMHARLGLPNSKRPGQWNNAQQRYLDQCGSFNTAIGGSNPGTRATETGTIAYAMWVSPEFYEMVIAVFIAVRNEKALSAAVYEELNEAHQELFADNAVLLHACARFNKHQSMCWRTACYLAGIDNPEKAMAYVFTKYTLWNTRNGKPSSMNNSGYDAGFSIRDWGRLGTGLDVRKGGRLWMIRHAEEINEATCTRKPR